MEKSHKDILYRLRRNIVDDIDIDNDIIQPLTSKYIIREEEVKRIYTGATKQTRAENLLDVLPFCGPNAFDVFHQSLKHHYEWISDEIDKLLDNYEIETNHEIDYYAGSPNIPPVSPLTVTREEKVDQLKEALQQLNPTEYVALHGMKGFGKSCLTASTLTQELVKRLFSNKVYWIKFACDRPIDEEILIQLNTLYHNVRNLEIQPELFTPFEKDSLIQFFKSYFNKQGNGNALLILDDVFDKKIIDTFDFKCKTLVLTADIDILRGKRPKIIEMNDGFTETETLGLFAKVLKINVNQLPIEAKRIHEECKGMPLLIDMFAAHFEEFKHDMSTQTKRWKYYLQCLRKKDTTIKVMKEFFEIQETIFDTCIEQLKPDLKTHYESLAIFSEDVNISPKTLEILWHQDIYKVDELMLDLCHKSLVVKKWNEDLGIYIYGVHDLLLCHLKKRLTPDILTQMHVSVIEKYRIYCDNDFSKLPDDNYIYSYIGYHLEHANLLEDFPSIYLDFNFIQAKIIHSGLSDLLLDLKKYRKYITCYYNKEYETKVLDMEKFLQEQASIIIEHRRKKCLDIIQIAMNHPHEGYIAQTAKNLAMMRKSYLYLSHDKNHQHVNMPLTEEISTGICTSSFIDPDVILTGNTSGKIILWNCESKQQKIFNGYSENCSIKKVIVSTNCDCFLALSNTGIIKLFPLDNDIFDEERSNVDSPRQKQISWSDSFINTNNQDDSLIEFSVKNEIILDMAFGHLDNYIAACTDKATIQIWDRSGEIKFTLRDRKYESITKIAFTAQASLLHIMDESKGAFVLYSKCGYDYSTYRYLACYNLQLKGEKVIFFHHVPKHDNSLMIVTEKTAVYVKWWWGQDHIVHSFSKQIRGFVETDKVTYVSAAITNDGEYIVMADSAGFINVWNTNIGYQPVATYKSRVTSLDTYWLKDDGYHMICGNGNRLLYRWTLPVQEPDTLQRKCLFDAIIEPYDKMDIVVKESHSKKLIVSRGNETIAEWESTEGKILSLQLSPDGNSVVYVTEHNSIMIFDITTETAVSVLKLNEPIEFLKIINIDNSNVVMCGWSNSNLKVWQQSKSGISIFGIDAERVTHVHKLDDNNVLIITQNGIMTIWYTKMPWQSVNEVDLPNSFSCISFSCLSYNQTYLAILNDSFCLVLYVLYKNAMCIQLSKHPYLTYTFMHKVTCCDISQNELFVAVGLETGYISIIDIQQQTKVTELFFHSHPITQLSWAPTTVNVPILLSLTSDELVWWNVALKKNKIKERGVKTVSGVVITNDVTGVNGYWKNKKQKDPEIPGLLAIVELPPSRNAKVCISPDFTKFVTVDMYGSVSTFKLINYAQPISER